MKAQLFFGVVSVFVALFFHHRRRANIAALRPWQPQAHGVLRYVIGMMVCVLAGDHLMVRGQDCGVNAATLRVQIYDILCERVTEDSHYCLALLLWQYGLVLVNLCDLGF